MSPDYQKLLIATIDTVGTGYFTLYYLPMINSWLDGPAGTLVKLSDPEVTCLASFVVEGFTTNSETNARGIIDSVQGYDIDKAGNIFISSELAPKKGNPVQHYRYIYRIPWGVKDSSQWQMADLSSLNMDVSNHISEFESVQVADPDAGSSATNNLYLTVSYHDKAKGSLTSNRHRIYTLEFRLD